MKPGVAAAANCDWSQRQCNPVHLTAQKFHHSNFSRRLQLHSSPFFRFYFSRRFYSPFPRPPALPAFNSCGRERVFGEDVRRRTMNADILFIIVYIITLRLCSTSCSSFSATELFHVALCFLSAPGPSSAHTSSLNLTSSLSAHFLPSDLFCPFQLSLFRSILFTQRELA